VLSIVIPAYAEARFLAGTMRALHAFLGARVAATEVIVVTADARDGTPELAARELARFPLGRQLRPGPKVGKGRDVRAGMLAARGDVVLFMDADLATPLRHVDAAIGAIAAGADVAIGRRDVARMHKDLGKALSSRLANALVQAVLLPGLGDTQCGFKAFRGELVRPLFEPLAALGWGFDLEVLARARRAGLAIRELPVPDWADPKGDAGLAGEIQWWARLRTLGELAGVVARLGRQPVQAPPVRCTSEDRGGLP
jgi:dolichyl-phosphate beta-glucosyltransferase